MRRCVCARVTAERGEAPPQVAGGRQRASQKVVMPGPASARPYQRQRP